jgi:hypothetical protein
MAASTVSSSSWLDLEVSPIQGQTAWSVLDLQGNILKPSGEIPQKDTTLLFQMLLESTKLVDDGFRRLTVSMATSRYLVSRDAKHVYLVQTRL